MQHIYSISSLSYIDIYIETMYVGIEHIGVL